ncbi:hypothetical protein ABZ845_10280 [Streptomyces sp. NPDC047022]|uniref:hypothetical protein n=1 Tax=Streptomyces sp. NPDC047022 TaxID=3155737 RepID=UPI0033E2A573
MSVARTTVRLIATGVASVALIGAAAMPALADGHGQGFDNHSRFSHDFGGPGHGFGGRDNDRDFRGIGRWDHGRYYYRSHNRDRFGHWLWFLAPRHSWDRYRHGR